MHAAMLAASRARDQIAVLANDDFAWFARYGLAIQVRNVLDDGTKQSKNLWYEETLPPDAVLYAIVMCRVSHYSAVFLHGNLDDTLFCAG